MTIEEALRARITSAIAELDVRRLQLVAEVSTELLEETRAARAAWPSPRPLRVLTTAEVLREVTGGARV